MIKVFCGKCKIELTEPGGIILGPPDVSGRVVKWHLCVRCYHLVVMFLKDCSL